MTASMFRALDVLEKHNVPTVVIGGHAVIVHGHIRATQDIDVVFARTAAVETSLAKALIEIDAFWIGEETDPSTGIEKTYPVDLLYVQSHRLMMVGSKFGYIDLFDYVPGLPSSSVKELFEDAIWIAGRRFASLDWLRRMKQASGRPQDLIDLENLPI